MSQSRAAFLDTSIQIARLIHSPETQVKIENRLRQFDLKVTSLVVRQEYKRRLLKDAAYLLSLFDRYESFAKVHRHIVDVLTPFQRRKQKISLQLLSTLFEDDSDSDLTSRAKLLLKGLLRDGLYEFDESVDHVIRESDCGCATQEVRRSGRRHKRYDFGVDKCNKGQGCGISEFLDTRREYLKTVLQYLEALPDGRLTAELRNAAAFIRSYLKNPGGVRSEDPCRKVGDLLIAMESVRIPIFYTMNGKESQHLCRTLDQCLIVRPSNPSKDDILCEPDQSEWPQF